MTTAQVLILIALIVGIVYITGFAYVIARASSFRKELRRLFEGTSVVYGQKKEVLLSLCNLYRAAGINLRNEDEEAITKVRWLKIEVKGAEEAMAAAGILNDLEKRLNYLEATNPWVNKGEEFGLYSDTLNDLNINYRRIVVNYNSAVQGYEYWRKYWAYYGFLYLFGFRKEEAIS